MRELDTEVSDLPYVIRPKPLRGTMAAIFAGVAVLFCGIPAAAQASACTATPTKKAFAAFGDNADYSLAPNGSFEAGSGGWSLTNSSLQTGNESYKVGGSADSKSLAVKATGKAVSPQFCVGIEHPTFRLFARRTSGTWGVLYAKIRWQQNGVTNETVVGSYSAGDTAWHPTQSFNLAPVLGIWNGDQSVQVQLVFDAETGGGNWAIDDVYVDPYSRG
jgi:hypothetical protein